MRTVTHAELAAAWTVLFGVSPLPGKLKLDAGRIKSVFRRRALETHPDRFAHTPPARQRHQAELFGRLSQAYEVLCLALEHPACVVADAPPAPARAPTPPPRERAPTPPPRPATAEPLANGTELGSFLLWKGAVTFQQLIDGLLWQRRQRPSVGELARRWGWLTEAQVKNVLFQPSLKGRFVERAVQLGLLRPIQARALLRFQRERQRRLGEYFVERGILGAHTLGELLLEHTAWEGPFGSWANER